MPDQQPLAIHETMELHEFLTFKSVCMTKSATMQAFVTDPVLKNLMQQDVLQSTTAIQEAQKFLSEDRPMIIQAH